MNTITELAFQYAHRYNRERDVVFRNLLENSISQARATIIKQESVNSTSKLPYHYYSLLEDIKMERRKLTSGIPSLVSTKKYYVSVQKLPKIITRNKPFIKYVGNITFTEAYTYIIPNRYEAISKGDRFSELNNYYTILDDYLVVFEKSVKHLAMEAIFHSYEEVTSFIRESKGVSTSTTVSCEGFKISDDMAQKIKSFVFNEFDTTRSVDKEINLNE